MAITTHTSSLRRRIMVVFILAIALVAISTAVVSYPILSATLVREGLSEDAARHIARHVSRIQVALALVGTSVTVLLALLLARTITEPLRRLLAGVTQIGVGRLDAHVPVAGDDELARLAAAFNDMTGKLGQARDHLESVVQERTAELARRNDELQTQVAERRRAEEQLRRSEERFTIMADSAKDAILMMDPAGHITFYNRTAETLFGWTADEAMGKDLHALLAPPQYHNASHHGVAHFRTSGEGAAIGQTLELTALRKDGTEFPMEISLAGVELDHEWHAIGIVRDITERRRIEEALRENEQRLQDVLNSILTGIFLVDPHTHIILDVNEAAARQVGRPKAETIGRVCHQFVCPAECGKCPVTDLGQTMDQSERILLTSDGVSVPIIKSVTAGTFQGRPCLIESFVPIARQKKAEEDLKESLSLLEATLESTADGILVVDGRGRIKNFNEQFKRLWRLSDEVLETRDDDEALAAATPLLTDPEAFVARVRELYSRREQEGNGTLHFQDGRVVEYYSKPQSVGDRITGRVWSFRDVTEAFRGRQRQEQLLRQVADINEELSHFAYVVSHDLKAPLRGIKLLTEWLCTDYRHSLGEDARENLDLLQSRVERMHNLIDGILQYSRVGRTGDDVTEVDLEALLPNIIDTIAPPEHITIRVEGRMPVIEGERTRITQVFQNLLSNAVKYMDKPVGEVVVGCAEDADTWTFRVSDNGPGIEEKYFGRIFKIFQTLASRDQLESTGVGLALVKKIVEYYGGRIWVVSEVGKGSTFFFTFPKRRTPATEPVALETESCR